MKTVHLEVESVATGQLKHRRTGSVATGHLKVKIASIGSKKAALQKICGGCHLSHLCLALPLLSFAPFLSLAPWLAG